MILAILLNTISNAQVQSLPWRDYSAPFQFNIGAGTIKRTNPTAYLELGDSISSTKGILFPRGNKDNITSPIKGLLFFDIPTNKPWYHNGTSWVDFSGAEAAAYTFNSPMSEAAGVVSIQVANGSQNGYLSAANWTTFNNKQNTLPIGTTEQYLRGNHTLATFPTLLSQFTNDSGYLTPYSAGLLYPTFTNLADSLALYTSLDSFLDSIIALKALIPTGTGADELNFINGLYRVGNDVMSYYWQPMWNASQIQGRFVDASQPGNHSFLGWDSTNNVLRWMKPDSAQLVAYYTQEQVDALLDDVNDSLAVHRIDIDAAGVGTGITDGDKGDITVTDDGDTWMVDDGAITNAKIVSMAFSKLTGLPTTLAGYGITNAYTITQTDSAIAANLGGGDYNLLVESIGTGEEMWRSNNDTLGIRTIEAGFGVIIDTLANGGLRARVDSSDAAVQAWIALYGNDGNDGGGGGGFQVVTSFSEATQNTVIIGNKAYFANSDSTWWFEIARVDSIGVGSVSWDADALDYITRWETAAGTTMSSDDKGYYNDFFIGLKAAELDTVFTNYNGDIAPFWGGTAATNAVCLFGNQTLTFVGSPTHSSTGTDWNASSMWAKTGWVPATELANNLFHISYYSGENLVSSGRCEMGVISTSGGTRSMQLRVSQSGTTFNGYAFNSTLPVTGTVAGSSGMFTMSRLTATSLAMYKNGSNVGTETTSDATLSPIYQLYIGAYNNNEADGSGGIPTARQSRGASWGGPMTSTQVAAFNTLYEALLDAQGRGVQ